MLARSRSLRTRLAALLFSMTVIPGDIFYIGPGHDSWVVGDEPYVSLHLLGAAQYAHK